LDFEAVPINEFKPLIKKTICFDFKSIKFPYNPIKILPNTGFRNPINKIKPLIKKQFVSISISIKFPYITQLKYCQKLDFEADPINKS